MGDVAVPKSRALPCGIGTLQAVPETAYASCGDLSLAYQVFGEGPVELVWAGSFASHVELYWTMPEFGSLMEKLGTFARVLLFDKAGVGLSDPVAKVRTLDERAAEIEAVMDAAGFGTAAILGVSEGGPAAILFAATRPERTRALILTGTTSYSFTNGWDDLQREPAELRARVVRELGEDYTPSTEWIARSQEFGRAIQSAWGTGEALKCVISSVRNEPGKLLSHAGGRPQRPQPSIPSPLADSRRGLRGAPIALRHRIIRHCDVSPAARREREWAVDLRPRGRPPGARSRFHLTSESFIK
jgi:pimeloyl-ACP methyl ester carboxylesterase